MANQSMSERLMKSNIWFRWMFISFMTAICGGILFFLGIYTLMAVGFRDGCVTPGSSSCYLPIPFRLEPLLIIGSILLFIFALKHMWKKQVLGYTLWYLFVVSVILQAGMLYVWTIQDNQRNNEYNNALDRGY